MTRVYVGMAVLAVLCVGSAREAFAKANDGGDSGGGLNKIACWGQYNGCLGKCDKDVFGPGRNKEECKNKCDYTYLNCNSGKKPARTNKGTTTTIGKPVEGAPPSNGKSGTAQPITNTKPIQAAPGGGSSGSKLK